MHLRTFTMSTRTDPSFVLPRRPPWRTAVQLATAAVFVAILAWAWEGAEIRPMELLRNGGNSFTFVRDFFPPNFHEWRLHLAEMAVTVQIALWGTVLAIVCAIPLGLLAAANIAPWWIHQPVRRGLDCFRAINEMVFALLFVVAVGLGPFAGVLALFIHTTGILGKLFSEVVEAIEPGPVEGIRATGAGRIQEILFGVIPQVLPMWVSYALYRFESNVRAATVVGMVGAGGIGMILWEAMRSFDYGQTAAIMIVILVTVIALDLLSAQVRKMAI
jgi:phosphonate transport system permease protein